MLPSSQFSENTYTTPLRSISDTNSQPPQYCEVRDPIGQNLPIPEGQNEPKSDQRAVYQDTTHMSIESRINVLRQQQRSTLMSPSLSTNGQHSRSLYEPLGHISQVTPLSTINSLSRTVDKTPTPSRPLDNPVPYHWLTRESSSTRLVSLPSTYSMGTTLHPAASLDSLRKVSVPQWNPTTLTPNRVNDIIHPPAKSSRSVIENILSSPFSIPKSRIPQRQETTIEIAAYDEDDEVTEGDSFCEGFAGNGSEGNDENRTSNLKPQDTQNTSRMKHYQELLSGINSDVPAAQRGDSRTAFGDVSSPINQVNRSPSTGYNVSMKLGVEGGRVAPQTYSNSYKPALHSYNTDTMGSRTYEVHVVSTGDPKSCLDKPSIDRTFSIDEGDEDIIQRFSKREGYTESSATKGFPKMLYSEANLNALLRCTERLKKSEMYRFIDQTDEVHPAAEYHYKQRIQTLEQQLYNSRGEKKFYNVCGDLLISVRRLLESGLYHVRVLQAPILTAYLRKWMIWWYRRVGYDKPGALSITCGSTINNIMSTRQHNNGGEVIPYQNANLYGNIPDGVVDTNWRGTGALGSLATADQICLHGVLTDLNHRVNDLQDQQNDQRHVVTSLFEYAMQTDSHIEGLQHAFERDHNRGNGLKKEVQEFRCETIVHNETKNEITDSLGANEYLSVSDQTMIHGSTYSSSERTIPDGKCEQLSVTDQRTDLLFEQDAMRRQLLSEEEAVRRQFISEEEARTNKLSEEAAGSLEASISDPRRDLLFEQEAMRRQLLSEEEAVRRQIISEEEARTNKLSEEAAGSLEASMAVRRSDLLFEQEAMRRQLLSEEEAVRRQFISEEEARTNKLSEEAAGNQEASDDLRRTLVSSEAVFFYQQFEEKQQNERLQSEIKYNEEINELKLRSVALEKAHRELLSMQINALIVKEAEKRNSLQKRGLRGSLLVATDAAEEAAALNPIYIEL